MAEENVHVVQPGGTVHREVEAPHFYVTPRALAALREKERSECYAGESLCLCYAKKPEGAATGIYKLPDHEIERTAAAAACSEIPAFIDRHLLGECPAIVVDWTEEESFADMVVPPTGSAAANPGKVHLSFERLLRFHPDFFLERDGFDPLEQSALIAMRLLFGDTRAAVVMGVEPNLIVAAYSDDLDAVALLRFSAKHVEAHQLSVGSRLLTVNTYTSGAGLAGDLFAGPAPQSAAFCNFHPLIADFLTEDRERLAQLRQSISEMEWIRARALGQAALAAHCPTRSGRPLRSGSMS